MFISHAEKADSKAFEIFNALDLDHSESAQYFKLKCEEVPSETLIKLRDKRIGNEGRTLLHNAARSGSLAAVIYLIRLGHEVEPVDSSLSKITPLMEAITYQNIEIAIVLVESGARLEKADINGENAFHYAARCGSARIIKWLSKASALANYELKEIASSTNIKLKFPEDLASNVMVKDLLVSLRDQGSFSSYSKKRQDSKRIDFAVSERQN